MSLPILSNSIVSGPSSMGPLPEPLYFSDLQSAADAQRNGPATPGTTADGAPGTTGAADGGAGAGQGGGMNFWMLAAIGAVIWFLIFAPERKARKQREEMLGALKKGDKVVTTGGLHASVVEIKETEVVLKAGETRLTYSRSAVHQVVDGSSAD